MGRPGGSGDEVAVGVSVVEVLARGNELASGEFNLGATGGIGADLAPFHDDPGGGEELRAVANGGDGFLGGGKVADDVEDARCQAEIFGRATAGNNERVIGRLVDSIERSVQAEIVTAFFAVGLFAFEVVNRSRDRFAGLLAWTNSVHLVADELEHLKGDHGFIVFDVIADEHQEAFHAGRE